MTSVTKNPHPPTKKFFLSAIYWTGRSIWALEQLSRAIGGGARVLVRQPNSYTFPSMPCHEAQTSAPLSAHLSTRWECTMSHIETPICACTQLNSSSDNNTCAAHCADHQWKMEWTDNLTTLYFHHWHRHPPPGMTLPGTVWVQLNHLRTSVGCFRSC